MKWQYYDRYLGYHIWGKRADNGNGVIYKYTKGRKVLPTEFDKAFRNVYQVKAALLEISARRAKTQ